MYVAAKNQVNKLKRVLKMLRHNFNPAAQKHTIVS